MPIANCIVRSDCPQGSSNLVELWADESGQPSEHMTINIIFSDEQIGNKYGVMATLLLPSIWPGNDISLLQIGLAKALAKHFNLSLSEVHVATSIVTSGMVVEEGEEIQW
jgi:hypothetical protein